MYIFLSLLIWTTASIAYFISRLGYKDAPRGFRKYFEYLICPPVLTIAFLVGAIAWLFKKKEIPMISSGHNTWANFQIPNHKSKKKYYTQIRVTGEKGINWTINVSSDEPMVWEMFSNRGDNLNNYPTH